MDTVIYIIYRAVEVYSWVLIAYILMSWFPNARDTAIGRFLTKVSEPYLEPFRRFVPAIGMFDISPIVALIVLRLAQSGLSQLSLWV
jgi:YggT family protein